MPEESSTSTGMKVFDMDGTEWWMARSKEEAIVGYKAEYGWYAFENHLEEGLPHELSEDEMNNTEFFDGDEICSFAKQLRIHVGALRLFSVVYGDCSLYSFPAELFAVAE